MNRRDFQVIAITGIVLGLLLLAGGIYAYNYNYTESYGFLIIWVHPYAAYSGGILGAGAMSIFVGIAAVLLAPPEETSVKPAPSPTNPKQPSST